MNHKNIEEEIDFKAVIKNPIRWFGLIYPYFIAIAVIIGIFWIYRMDFVFKNQLPPALLDTVNIFKDVPMAKGSFVPGVDLIKLNSERNTLAEKGKELFKSNCASCHGDDGKGDGPAGNLLNPKPRNFHSSEGWKNGMKFSDMFKTLKEGIPTTAMTPYEFIPVADRVAIIYYIMSFNDKFPAITEAELKELATKYDLAGDKLTPSTIPVFLAMEKVVTDASNINDLENKIFQKLENLGDGYNSAIIKKYISNNHKSARFLATSGIYLNDKSKFLNALYSGFPNNGFKPGILTANSSEYDMLINGLSNLIEVK